jgi:hypothetical protein
MSEERKKVLAMLAEGKITADEAERLLQKLGEGDAGEGGHRHHGGRRHRRFKRLHFGPEALPKDDTEAAAADKTAEFPAGFPKYLRVEINSSDDDRVSVRVPLRLIRTGIKLTTMLPSETSAKLAAKGIDLSELGKLEGEDLVDALRDLKVNVDSANGDTVRVFCE